MDSPSSTIPGSGSWNPVGGPAQHGGRARVLTELSLAVAVYGMAGWIYVAICALVAPATLALPLTHLLPSLREDTSGVLSFILSFLGFISFRLTRHRCS
jgi:hypothetical protein